MIKNLVPTDEMIDAGISEFIEYFPNYMETLYEDMNDDEIDDFLSDAVVFIYQAMQSENKE